MADLIPASPMPTVLLSVASTSLKWLETNNLFNNLIQRNQSAAFSSGKVRPNHETNINIIARRTGKDVNSHTVLDGIITTIMATIQRINIIGSREGSRNRRRPPLPALTVKLSKYNVDDVALGVCKTGAEEAGVTEVRTSLSEKKFELWREIKV